MKKITIGAFLFILLITVQVMYINYRLEQKLDNIQLNQQNILTQVYSLERSTQQTTLAVSQILQKQQLTSKKQNLLLTNNEINPARSNIISVQEID